MILYIRDKNGRWLNRDDIIKFDHDYYMLDYNDKEKHWVLLGLSTERIIVPPGLLKILNESERISTINNELIVDLIILFQEYFTKGE